MAWLATYCLLSCLFLLLLLFSIFYCRVANETRNLLALGHYVNQKPTVMSDVMYERRVVWLLREGVCFVWTVPRGKKLSQILLTYFLQFTHLCSLKPWWTKQCPWTSSISITWEFIRNTASGPFPDRLNQNKSFN